jgi:hypothetical protein
MEAAENLVFLYHATLLHTTAIPLNITAMRTSNLIYSMNLFQWAPQRTSDINEDVWFKE